MSRSKIVAAVLAASLVGSLSAQSTLSTLFADNNSGSSGGAVYFDITVTNTVRITSLETNYSAAATTACGVKLYTVPKTYVGNEQNKAAWTLAGQDDGKAVCAGRGLRTKINLASPVLLVPGTYGIALEAVGSGHAYTNGTATNNSYKDTNIALQLGAASNVPFTGSPFTPRIWNGSITYTLGQGTFANFSADKTTGSGPLTVQFKDTTYTTNGPITKWAWDFNGDSKIDATTANPSYTYPKTTWDATYDVTLTVTDSKSGTSKLTKKAFIIVDPSNATAVDFGLGSTNKPVNSPIGQPVNTSIYSASTGIRGFHFVAPTTFVVTGFEAPNDASPKETDQTVVCYVMASQPASNYTATAADVKFFATGKANTILKPTKPIIVTKGQWFGVFGACHASTSGSLLRNAYASGGYKTTVLGQPITIDRMWMNSDPRVNKGLGAINPTTGTIARVFVYVSGNTTVPLLTTSGLPQLGATPKLDLQGKFAGIQGGLVFMSGNRLPVPVPTVFGNLLINPSILASIFVPTGTGILPLPIPNSSSLTGAKVDWQGMVFDLTTNTFGMTNGSEWFIGK